MLNPSFEQFWISSTQERLSLRFVKIFELYQCIFAINVLSPLKFFTPVFDWTYYCKASTSVHLSICPGFVGRTVSSRILQLGTFDQHDEEDAYCFSRSKVEAVLSHSRKTWGYTVGRLQTEQYVQESYNLVQ